MKSQKLLDDHSNPWGPTIGKNKLLEKEVYNRREKGTYDKACFT